MKKSSKEGSFISSGEVFLSSNKTATTDVYNCSNTIYVEESVGSSISFWRIRWCWMKKKISVLCTVPLNIQKNNRIAIRLKNIWHTDNECQLLNSIGCLPGRYHRSGAFFFVFFFLQLLKPYSYFHYSSFFSVEQHFSLSTNNYQ